MHKRGRRKGEPELIDGMIWICGDHWRLVPVELRRQLKKLDRLKKRAERKNSPALSWLQQRRHNVFLEARRLAIEIAAGITAARPMPARNRRR